jgi:hypothetical protein
MSYGHTYTQDAVSELDVLGGMDCCVWLADIYYTIHHAVRLNASIHHERFGHYNCVVSLYRNDIHCKFSASDVDVD